EFQWLRLSNSSRDVKSLVDPLADAFVDLALEGRGQQAQFGVHIDGSLEASQGRRDHRGLDLDLLHGRIALDLDFADTDLFHEAIDVGRNLVVEFLGAFSCDRMFLGVARHGVLGLGPRYSPDGSGSDAYRCRAWVSASLLG